MLVTISELSNADEYPTQIYGVVTNDASVAEWARTWNANLVEVELQGDSLRLIGRTTRTFDRSHMVDALAFTSEELDALPAEPPEAGLSVVEHRKLEIVLGHAHSAVSDTALDALERATLQAAVDTLRAQLASPEPDRHIIGRVLHRFTSFSGGILIGVLGNYATDLLQNFPVPWP